MSNNVQQTIRLKGEWSSRRVWLNGKELHPGRSQKVWNHSPDGFNWGYGGSGPAQLALAICLQLYDKVGEGCYQDFKFRYIATLPQSDFDFDIVVPTKEEVILSKWRVDENFTPSYVHARYKQQP